MRNDFLRRGARIFRPAPQTEVDDELAFHVQARIDEYIVRGMDPAAARAAALERFGDWQGVRRECTQLLEEDRRRERRRAWLDDLRQDLRFGVRAALRSPLFSLLAVLTLAFGIGANAAVFGVVKSVFLDALPYRDADRLVRIYARVTDGSIPRSPLSAGTLMDLRERQRSFSDVAAFYPTPVELTWVAGDGPRVLKAAFGGADFFRALGVRATLGRTLVDADATTGAAGVGILTWDAWQRLFAGDPRVIGRVVRLDGTPNEIVGVLPRGFVGPMGDADLFIALDLTPVLRDPVRARKSHWLGAVARLAPGVTLERAQRDVAAIAADLAREHPDAQMGITMFATPLRDDMVGDTRTPLLVLMASAALVLVITCANLAGALLSRALARRREFAVRMAIGAGRGRLVRQLLTESVLLAVVGGAAGLALAALGLAVLRRLALPALPPYAHLSLDPGALAFAAAIALATGLAFGLAPAVSVSRANPHGTLRDETRGTSESRRTRELRGLLVAGQIALCVSLLAGAGLLTRSLLALTSAPLGFDPDGVFAAAVRLPFATYGTPASWARFFDQLETRAKALPGVSGVASVSELPTQSLSRNGLTIEGVQWPGGEGQPFITSLTVSDDFFRTMRVALRAGRTFGPQDRDSAPPAIVISDAMARRYWPTGNALGAHIRLGPDNASPWATIVGIVADVRNDPTKAESEPIAYASSRQNPWSNRWLVLRTSGDPQRLARPLEHELAALDPALPIYRSAPLRQLIAEGLSGRRLPVVLMGAFGALALLLASVGVYAMFASMAAAREREFGVRMALGSSPRAIAVLVLRQGGLWMALGLAGGAAGVVLVTRALRGLLVGVRPFDPVALGSAVLVLLVCGTIALLVPVRRATRVDPVSVLR